MLTEILVMLALGVSACALGLARQRRRMTREVLEHPLRRSLWQRILRRPGARPRDLYQALVLTRGTVNYHLRILVRARALQARHEWGMTRYFPPHMPARDMHQYSLLLRGRVLEFAKAVIENPGVAQDQLFRKRRLSRKILGVYVPKLVEEGLLRVERGTLTKYFHPTDELRRLVAGIERPEPGEGDLRS